MLGYSRTAASSEILAIEPKMRSMPFESAGDLAHCGIAASSNYFESERLVLLHLVHLVDGPDLALLAVQMAPAQLYSSSAEPLLHLEF